jgi:predicted RNA-binding protein (virulence factor B family)
MVEIGKYNKLKIMKESRDGVYLDAKGYGVIFLSAEQAPADCRVGEALEVFLYCDSNGMAIPTTQKPYVLPGEFACLKVVDVLSIGAFLDWGLPKDLFVPLCEQKENMEKGESYVVRAYKDKKQDRVAATTKLDTFLNKELGIFLENEKVDLLICNQTELGYNAIINNTHWGLLYKEEVFQDLKYGQRIEGFIKKVREDGRIDLSLQIQGYQKMDNLQEKIIAQINNEGGVSNLTDKSTPDIISKLFGVSKKKYKMALGSLYKSKRIIIEDDAIRIIK